MANKLARWCARRYPVSDKGKIAIDIYAKELATDYLFT